MLLPSDPTSRAHFFPTITSYYDKAQQTEVRFKYVRPLEQEAACITFLARTDSLKDVVVKFVDRYKSDVHEFLAAHQYAPQLLYYGPIDSNGPSYGPLRLVVMEYVQGQTLFTIQQGLLPITFSHPSIPATLNKIISLLHNKDFVHGDLRSPNILITEEEDLKIIDFDWAGRAGSAHYPPLLSRAIHWPLGADGDELITKAHDREMISNCLNHFQKRSRSPSATARSQNSVYMSGNAHSQNPVFGNTRSQNPASGNTRSQNPASGNTRSQNSVSGNTRSQNPLSHK